MDKISKNEWELINIVYNLGVTVVVITKDIDSNRAIISRDADIRKYNTSQNLSLDTDKQLETLYGIYSDFNKTDEEVNINRESIVENMESIVYYLTSVKNNKLALLGYDSEIPTDTIAAKLYEESKTNKAIVFLNKKIDKPTLDETSKIYKLNKNDINYLVQTTKMFIYNDDKVIADKIKLAFEQVVNELYSKEKNCQLIYNKAVTLICWLNRYIKNGANTIVFYGIPSGNDMIFIDLLNRLDFLNCIILSCNKEGIVNQRNTKVIKLNNSKNDEDITLISTDTVSTLAYSASQRLDATLFNDTIGLYREGQITDCDTKHMACTFDEVKMWWNKEMYLRPGFEKQGNKVIIPTQFAVVRGINTEPHKFPNTVQMYTCGKTLLYKGRNFSIVNGDNGPTIHNLVDINGTLFSEQKKLIVGGKLQTEIIKSSRNYKYGFLDLDKQNFILSKIQEIIDDNKLNVPSEYINRGEYTESYYDTLLTNLLNLSIETLRIIQWFNFTDYNPNVVVISSTENTLTFWDALYLRFLGKLGFDILVFVPTQYSSIENFIHNSEYEVYTIGRPEYSIDFSSVHVKENENYVNSVEDSGEKRSFFTKIGDFFLGNSN